MPAHRQGLRATTAADAGIWKALSAYLNEWRDKMTISWVKALAEDGGAVTNDHENENKKADEDAGGACKHPDTPIYREGYCSQFNSIWDQ